MSRYDLYRGNSTFLEIRFVLSNILISLYVLRFLIQSIIQDLSDQGSTTSLGYKDSTILKVFVQSLLAGIAQALEVIDLEVLEVALVVLL